MINARDHPQESLRVQALLKYEVLDTNDERCFDELTELASIIFGTTNFSLRCQRLNLTLDIGPELMVFADDMRLKTVLRNLLSNAVKYSQSNNEILTQANQVDNAIVVAAKNIGQTIPDTLKAKLFNETVASESGTLGEPENGL
jgi:signal transduction histidine kinase